MKGIVRINGRQYKCEVINGERFIDGKAVADFLADQDEQTMSDMAIVGKQALADEKSNQLGGLQNLADALHSRKVN
jgi:hypothetical protein